ncbi:MAG: aminotransferase class I/II-fold pyridoxal phosphate-dependent enzyme [Alphaproteobacteria bacterium]|jgi:histidinol-phosphate aminotransferase|nr:aminotransferase class I/II-fold pyridoxal phosphate-dependent enzyme [Alphaproteobacteria bacterium]MBT4086764.1 aminotransferase class I/II-fold pyridoxal phosphate-dependent enzyme [Alphaproteobacteria bacterium]MBT4545070.1 aminotransferase class I/II-fold pyridoxal phosphate-dependent enzyme [Alphaproteobacteria bacterium]MBT7746344.1 aminotransferase class I/II-fold pyridoxal phosphate-dependent enzyme [Alphaproteobacteria bacterium]
MTGPKTTIDPVIHRSTTRAAHPLGLPLIDLSLNESPWPPSPLVTEAARARSSSGNRYPDQFSSDLREAIARTYHLHPEHLVVGNGSEELLDVIGRAFVRPGDQILISEHGYIQFPLVAARLGAEMVRAKETDCVANVDNLLAAVTPATKLVFLAVPNNPTGTNVPVAEVERLVGSLPSDVALVLDLAYGEYVGWDYCARYHELAAQHENVFVLRTFSKAFGLAAFHVGWVHAAPEYIPVLETLCGIANVNAIAQAAAAVALTDLDYVSARVAETIAERTRVSIALEALGFEILPAAANFLMVSHVDDANAWADFLYEKAGIIVRRVREPGLQHFVRFSIGTSLENDLLIQTTRQFPRV